MQIKQIIISATLVTAALGLTGCAGMSNQDKNTAVGAGIGAVGGAAVGGVIGNQVKTTK